MPLYQIQKCKCGFAGDAFAKVKDLQDGRVPCPCCGVPCEQEYSAKVVTSGNRRFHGTVQRSIAEGWTKRTAKAASKMLHDKGYTEAANCVDQQTGRVLFKDREQQQRYAEAMYRIRCERNPELAK